MRAERAGKGWIGRDLFPDISRADLVEPEPAIRLWNLEAGKIEVGGFAQQRSGQRPVMRVQPFHVGKHFLPHELRRRLAKQLLLVAQLFADEEVVGADGFGKEAAAADGGGALY